MVLRNVDPTSFIIYSIMIGLFQSRVMHILKEKKNIYIYILVQNLIGHIPKSFVNMDL